MLVFGTTLKECLIKYFLVYECIITVDNNKISDPECLEYIRRGGLCVKLLAIIVGAFLVFVQQHALKGSIYQQDALKLMLSIFFCWRKKECSPIDNIIENIKNT